MAYHDISAAHCLFKRADELVQLYPDSIDVDHSFSWKPIRKGASAILHYQSMDVIMAASRYEGSI
jgi:hypothetical protein